jgi:AcrR family transcriptional regulator
VNVDPSVPANDRPERRRGRPRSARAHRAILDAALSLLVEEGYDTMSIEAVAERAGVGKATIYRRWDSKEELVADA